MRRAEGSTIYGGRWMVAATLGPALTLFGVFVLWPALQALPVSLDSWTGYTPTANDVGLDNYRQLLDDEHFWRCLTNTLYYVVVGGVAHFAFAFLFAWALHHPRVSGKKLYQTLIFFPSFISVAGVGVLWALLYEPHNGLLNRILAALGVEGPIWLSADHGMDAIIAASVWAGVGGHMIILLAGLRRIPTRLLDAARLDGAGELSVFWFVTLPLLRNVTFVALALWLIGAVQVFGLVQVLAPFSPDLQTVATYHYAISFNARDNVYMMGRGTAMALLLLVLVLGLVAFVRLLFRRTELEY
jgi:ABC-type sugar transport system permease subunit